MMARLLVAAGIVVAIGIAYVLIEIAIIRDFRREDAHRPRDERRGETWFE